MKTDITLNYGDITEEYVASTWNLPHWMIEQCDTYRLERLTTSQLTSLLVDNTDKPFDPDNSYLLLDGITYKAVWHNEAAATIMNPQVFPSEPEFLVSFRKIGKIKLALVQRKRK
jgi:isopropylmalate/homocitrate/citramalate synthase